MVSAVGNVGMVAGLGNGQQVVGVAMAGSLPVATAAALAAALAFPNSATVSAFGV